MVDVQQRKTTVQTRDVIVDTARGIACILLVLYHVIGFERTGLRLDDDEPIRKFNSMLVYLRMPLFTILSGYVYARRPFGGDWQAFVGGKAKRLLIPLLVVGTLFAVVQSLTPGTNGGLEGDDWLTIHIEPVQHFWYLEALFWVFLVVMGFERMGWLRRPAGAIAVLAVSGVVSSLVHPPRTLGFEGAVYLLPFFVFGVMVYRFRDEALRPRELAVGIPVAVVSLGFCVASVLDGGAQADRTSLVALVAGCSSGLVLLRSRFRVGWLARVGLYSYTIYLFHTFGTSAARIGLESIGVHLVALHLVVGLVAGISAPMILDLVVRNSSLARTMLLGRRRPGLS